VLNFSKLIIDKDGGINLNFEDDIVKGTAITNGGKVVNDRVLGLLGA
jgi:NAD(P) transhydrogenase subunit alpha